MSKAAALELKPADESRVSFEIESVKPKAKLDLKSMLDVVWLVTVERFLMQKAMLKVTTELRRLCKSWGY